MESEKIEDIQRAELFRDYLIEEKCEFRHYRATNFLKEAHFYLETFEEFISKEKSSELTQLDKHADRLPESQRGAFWAQYYPIHWSEIFEKQLRSSFIISLSSFAEDYLKHICWEVAIIERVHEDPREWGHSIFKETRKFLKNQGGFSSPTDSDWTFLYRIYDIRNVYVHHGGNLNRCRDASKIEKFISLQPGISESNGFIELEKEFCFVVLEVVERMIRSLYEEQVAFCTRAA
ncbi:MAG: hypothetical protein J7M27_11070 [Candidatus Latescibacteria bacterium]|nr:hypothetical protein [Candidatus Latescibacterota bacterium]